MARSGHRRSISTCIQGPGASPTARRRRTASPDRFGRRLKSVQYTDPNGTVVRIQLTGPGSASVNLAGTGLAQSSNARGIVVSGSGVILSNLSAGGTLTTSSLQISDDRQEDGEHAGTSPWPAPLSSIKRSEMHSDGAADDNEMGGIACTCGRSEQQYHYRSRRRRRWDGNGRHRSEASANETLQSAVRINTLTASQWVNPRGVGSITNLSESPAPADRHIDHSPMTRR